MAGETTGGRRNSSSSSSRREMSGWWLKIAAVVAVIGVFTALSNQYRLLDKDAALQILGRMSDRLGYWAIPTYVALHTLTLALCLPYAMAFEAGASLLFGFFPAVLCVFSAKVLGASLSFWIGRLVFRRSSWAIGWAKRNKYFDLLSKGVERDGWKFVLLARFSPIPSYIINYGLAATEVGFIVDFLLPSVIGCLPMILQNTSIGSLASAAVASASTSAAGSPPPSSQLWAYLFPLLGILSSILISFRIKNYSSGISSAAPEESSSSSSSQPLSSSRK